jgi:hypothetical protein
MIIHKWQPKKLIGFKVQFLANKVREIVLLFNFSTSDDEYRNMLKRNGRKEFLKSFFLFNNESCFAASKLI